ncbi:ABC transporter substrate-binding protein, partial [Devosia sp.]|uniref:ABC transporter substrate-binding protein n=1 Tax=Devosia sp. TaxID=1871048 RepID=UPI0035AF104E
QALRYLVDYDGMANSFLKGSAQVHQSFWATGFWASYDENPYTFDPAKAKELLAAAGYPDGFSLDLDAPNFAPFTNLAQTVQATFAEGGVKVNIVSSEMAPMLTKYRAREHQALMVYWGPDYMDPHTNADGFVTNTDNTDAATGGKPLAWRNSWDSPELTAMTATAAKERDEATRKQMYIDLQKKVLDDGPYIIMFQSTSQRAERANVEGFVQGSSSDIVYYNLTTK